MAAREALAGLPKLAPAPGRGLDEAVAAAEQVAARPSSPEPSSRISLLLDPPGAAYEGAPP